MVQIKITPAEPQDTPKLENIYLVDRQQDFPWVAQPELADYKKDSEGEFVLVARVDGEIAGFATLYRLENFIHLLFIDSKHRRQGVGGALIQALRQFATQPMTLKCVMSNENALAFYAQEGFQIIQAVSDEVPPYYTLQDTKLTDYLYVQE